MIQLALSRSRILSGALLMGCVVLIGCSASGPHLSSQAHQPENLNLLCLNPSPHSRLYVEIDAVEGCEPKAIALQKLHDYLSTLCNKPDGIEIVRSDVIPKKVARGISPRELARKYINGPEQTNGSSPAFMYVLYYPGRVGRGNPYSETYPYPATYFNTRFSMGMALNGILLHEAGHLLGLVHRESHAADGHCRNYACYMGNHWAYVRQFRWFPGTKENSLCDECVAELKADAAQSPFPKSHYSGPVLVRSESAYDVLTLPDRILLSVGGSTEQDCREFAIRARTNAASADDVFRIEGLTAELLNDSAKVCSLLSSVWNDPFLAVRKNGPNFLLRKCLKQYHSARQYSNTVAVLQKTVELDPKSEGAFNLLAWTKATSPDESVRNGDEAVAAARKACELTEWKNRQFIDTLAAAYAEAGDFKHAIEFQQQALKTGKPNKSDQQTMRERLSLYEQSKPFREN